MRELELGHVRQLVNNVLVQVPQEKWQLIFDNLIIICRELQMACFTNLTLTTSDFLQNLYDMNILESKLSLIFNEEIYIITMKSANELLLELNLKLSICKADENSKIINYYQVFNHLCYGRPINSDMENTTLFKYRQLTA